MIQPVDVILKRKGFELVDRQNEPVSYTPYSNVYNVLLTIIYGKYSIKLSLHDGGIFEVECSNKTDAQEFYKRIVFAIEIT